MVDNNGWAEHKRLVEFRLDKAEEFQEEVISRLQNIEETLSEIKVERSLGKWVLMVAVPIAITIVFNVVARKLGM